MESIELISRGLLDDISQVAVTIIKYQKWLIHKWKRQILACHFRRCRPRLDDDICFGVLGGNQEYVVEKNCSFTSQETKGGNPEIPVIAHFKLCFQWSKDHSRDSQSPIGQLLVLIPECTESYSQSPYLCFCVLVCLIPFLLNLSGFLTLYGGLWFIWS